MALEAAFRRIAETRMRELPILNSRLQVEAVAFRPWQAGWIGVLITPWFMNLICLPDPHAVREPVPSGSTRTLTLPSGDYDFLTAEEEIIGSYLTSSLFSPMFDFADMEQTRAVAQSVLEEVFKAAPELAAVPTAPEGIVAKLERPVSRRGFLSAFLPQGERT